MVGKMALMWPKRILKCSGERWPWSIGRVSLGEAQNPGAINPDRWGRTPSKDPR